MAGKISATEERIGRVGQRRQVVIPREIFENLDMRVGDFVAVEQLGRSVIIKPKKLVDPDDALTPAEARKVRHALKQVRQGKTKPLAQIKHELGL
jgi:bifunctional DNA-binding transcriptional regulator/antitoxin component of YhaV-PrlF toxin-antitoxin module